MASNLFINIPVPAADGAGTAVDVSALGGEKTIVIGVTLGPQGEDMRCALTIEMSNAAAAPVADNEWAAIPMTFQTAGEVVLTMAAKWFRVRRANSRFPAGTPTCDIGAVADAVLIANLPAPAGNGVGASVDVSAKGGLKTVTVGGAYGGQVNIEISQDNTHFADIMTFQGVVQQQTAIATAHWMRVGRTGVPVVAPGLPVVNLAAGDEGGSGGGGGTMFTVAGVAAQSLYAVTLPTARTDANYEVIAIVNSPAANMWKGITIDPTSITNTGFNAEMTAGAEAGDVLVFYVQSL